jgi:FkbM family methyltransferase
MVNNARVRMRVALGWLLAKTPWMWSEAMRGRSLLRPLAAVMRHRPLGGLDTFVLPDDPSVRLAATDSLMVRRLYWYGATGYEGAELRWWRHFAARAHHIVEMGANVGFYTVYAGRAAPSARVVVVEAHPDSAAAVRRNLALNQITNVEVVEAAVVGVKATDTLELLLPDAEVQKGKYAAPTGAYLSRGEIIDRPASRSVTVSVIAASDLMSGADLLKLDIEGVEADVLSAAEHQISEARPVIFLEVLHSATRLRSLIADWHRRLDYIVFAIGMESLHLITITDLNGTGPLPHFGTRDVILVPREGMGLI